MQSLPWAGDRRAIPPGGELAGREIERRRLDGPFGARRLGGVAVVESVDGDYCSVGAFELHLEIDVEVRFSTVPAVPGVTS